MDDLVNRLRASAHKMTQTHAILQRGYGAQTSMEDDAEREVILDAAADLLEAQAAQLQEAREAMQVYVDGCEWQTPPPHCDRPAHLCCKAARAFLAKSQ
jgi:hypothetical protein